MAGSGSSVATRILTDCQKDRIDCSLHSGTVHDHNCIRVFVILRMNHSVKEDIVQVKVANFTIAELRLPLIRHRTIDEHRHPLL